MAHGANEVNNSEVGKSLLKTKSDHIAAKTLHLRRVMKAKK
jgi:hypothetical protein